MKNSNSNLIIKNAVSLFSYFSILFLSIVLAFIEDFPLSLESSQILVILMVFLVCIGLSVNKHSFSSWYLWFVLIFIVLNCFGTIVGVFSFGLGYNFLDYATHFSNNTSNSAASKSYIVTSFVLGVLYLCHPIANYFEQKSSSVKIVYSHDYYVLGRLLIMITLPFVLYNLGYQIRLVSSYGYAYLYTDSYQKLTDALPFMYVFVNLNKIGFLLVFASFPNLKKLNVYFIAFLFVSFFDALKGARVLLILPFIWVIFYRIRYYGVGVGIGGANKLKLIFLSAAGFVFLFIMQMVRSGQNISFDIINRFLVISISKAQYHLAVYIENSELLSRDFPYFLSTLIFPVTYLKHGSAVVGQSESTALLRGDLNHVMSSTLNYSAYIEGAGMGSALISELYQYGILVLMLLLVLFVFLYSFFMYVSTKYKILLVLQPLLFMHVIFSPRDSAFPNTWIYIKFIVFIVFILLIYHLTLKSSSQKTSVKRG